MQLYARADVTRACRFAGSFSRNRGGWSPSGSRVPIAHAAVTAQDVVLAIPTHYPEHGLSSTPLVAPMCQQLYAEFSSELHLGHRMTLDQIVPKKRLTPDYDARSRLLLPLAPASGQPHAQTPKPFV